MVLQKKKKKNTIVKMDHVEIKEKKLNVSES